LKARVIIGESGVDLGSIGDIRSVVNISRVPCRKWLKNRAVGRRPTNGIVIEKTFQIRSMTVLKMPFRVAKERIRGDVPIVLGIT